MPRMTRGNVVLHVKENEVQHYLNLGYNLTTTMGKIIEASIPTDLGTLQMRYIEQKDRITALETEIVRLTAENESLKLQVKPVKKSTPKAAKS